jgi:translation elongation factor EF-G
MEVLNFNQVGFETELQTKKTQIEIYNKLLNCIESITSIRELKSLDEIDTFIKEKTGFANVQMSASLLAIEAEYKYIAENVNKLDLSDFLIANNKSSIELKTDVVEALKEKYTTYLTADKEAIYKKLNSAIKLLNELHPYVFRCVSQDYKGSYSINKLMLHNLDLR